MPAVGGRDGNFRSALDVAIINACDMPAHGIDPVTPARAGDGGKEAVEWYLAHADFTEQECRDAGMDGRRFLRRMYMRAYVDLYICLKYTGKSEADAAHISNRPQI
jgi:hypothetical protein